MDVIFETQIGKAFCIEVGFFDTVLEIKEKVQKYQGIPVAKQTLVFKGQVLQDERDVQHCQLLQNSHVHLIVASDSDYNYTQKPQVNGQPQQQAPLPSKETQLNVNAPSFTTPVPLQMDANDQVLLLKDKVQDQTEPVDPVNWLVVHSDERQLTEDEIVEILNIITPPTSPEKGAAGNIMPPPGGSDMLKLTWKDSADVNTMAAAPRTTGGSDMLKLTWKDSADVNTMAPAPKTTSSEKLKVLVLPRHGTKKIPVEMNATDNVGELRKELEKLQKRILLPLPPEGYFFIHKQSVMEDDRSFKWHHVRQGDTIEIFNGFVTRGTP
ncbi:hypothetical protein V6N13_015382 [Hibiscus sabdariffa]|uniref:Ubiquitin-like domain-containing protein n=1 Tax=Hibiscus sabdariffa TaxID=183260 RepID=A0ABR2CX70_9ROSI